MATLVGQHGMKGETVRPRINGKANMKLVEKKLKDQPKGRKCYDSHEW